jgi:hypothetical protein
MAIFPQFRRIRGRHFPIRAERQPLREGPLGRRPNFCKLLIAGLIRDGSDVYLRSVSDSFMILMLEIFTPQGGNSLGVKKLSESFE